MGMYSSKAPRPSYLYAAQRGAGEAVNRGLIDSEQHDALIDHYIDGREMKQAQQARHAAKDRESLAATLVGEEEEEGPEDVLRQLSEAVGIEKGDHKSSRVIGEAMLRWAKVGSRW